MNAHHNQTIKVITPFMRVRSTLFYAWREYAISDALITRIPDRIQNPHGANARRGGEPPLVLSGFPGPPFERIIGISMISDNTARF
jgi:hypothetical protein